jgi:hypothetical protein
MTGAGMSKSLFEENASILRGLEADGVDLNIPRLIDFSQIFHERASAEAFGEGAKLRNFSIRIEGVGDAAESWDVTASLHMAPTCINITETEQALEALARQYGGRVDGWGFLRP